MSNDTEKERMYIQARRLENKCSANIKTTALTHNEQYCPMAIYNPFTQTTTHSSRYVIHRYHCPNQFSFNAYRPNGNAHSVLRLKPARAMWPCCDFTSSNDDEHITDNNLLFLIADVGITLPLFEGLTEVDVLHIALGCIFALDIFTISSPTLFHEPLPHDS